MSTYIVSMHPLNTFQVSGSHGTGDYGAITLPFSSVITSLTKFIDQGTTASPYYIDITSRMTYTYPASVSAHYDTSINAYIVDNGPFPSTITLDAVADDALHYDNTRLTLDFQYILPASGGMSGGEARIGATIQNYSPDLWVTGTVSSSTAPGASPALLGRPSRHYNRAVAKLNSDKSDSLGILFWRSDKAVPCLRGSATGQIWDTPAAGVSVTTTASDRNPRLAEDARTLLYLIFGRPTLGAMLTRSDDDGATWNTPTLAITGGRHPNIISGGGRTLAAAVTGTGTTFHITGVYRGPGDAAFGTPFTFNTSTTGSAGTPLLVADDSFGLAFAAEGPDRIVMHVLLAADAATSDWWSANNGATWTRIPLV